MSFTLIRGSDSTVDPPCFYAEIYRGEVHLLELREAQPSGDGAMEVTFFPVSATLAASEAGELLAVLSRAVGWIAEGAPGAGSQLPDGERDEC